MERPLCQRLYFSHSKNFSKIIAVGYVPSFQHEMLLGAIFFHPPPSTIIRTLLIAKFNIVTVSFDKFYNNDLLALKHSLYTVLTL